ncbi:site-specific integrase, partial [Acinetobacter baumannii]
GIDLEQRIKSKDFLKLNEIEAIVNLTSFNRSRLGGADSKTKIISFPKSNNKERSRAKLDVTQDYVSKQLIYRRLTNFAEYIGWFETH